MDSEWIGILQVHLDITSKTIQFYYYIFHFRKAVALNYVKAYTRCGDMLYSGKGCGKRDKSEAFKCYHKAASCNDPEALNSLALMIELGFDDRVADPDYAMEIYKKAIKLGSSDAAINLALIYLNVNLKSSPSSTFL